MANTRPTRVLVVIDHDLDSPTLVDAIRERAAKGPTKFRVLVPNPAPSEWHPLHPERHVKAHEAESVLGGAMPAIEEAAGAPVIGSISIRHDPMDAVESALHSEPFDEIMLAHHPHGIERWMPFDLAHRLAHLGVPVTPVAESATAPTH
jgi:hypothetical protein